MRRTREEYNAERSANAKPREQKLQEKTVRAKRLRKRRREERLATDPVYAAFVTQRQETRERRAKMTPEERKEDYRIRRQAYKKSTIEQRRATRRRRSEKLAAVDPIYAEHRRRALLGLTKRTAEEKADSKRKGDRDRKKIQRRAEKVQLVFQKTMLEADAQRLAWD